MTEKIRQPRVPELELTDKNDRPIEIIESYPTRDKVWVRDLDQEKGGRIINVRDLRRG